jgi:nitrite reductase/ring-hydroxylating ferredoxin subunit
MKRLCDADTVVAGRATLARLSQAASIILLRQADDSIIGYRNICPHMGIELDWEPARLLTRGGDFLRCTGHGALFEATTGLCTRGPCQGEALIPVSLHIQDGVVMLDV